MPTPMDQQPSAATSCVVLASRSSLIRDFEQECTNLDELRRANLMCDGLIRTGDTEFPVHRAVLAASSPYFRALFTHSVGDAIRQEVIIPDVAPDIMEGIIEHAYLHKTTITTDNVERLLPAAGFFHLPRLLDECCNYLEKQLDAENCLGIRNFARNYFCSQLTTVSHRYALAHFPRLAVRSDELLSLSKEDFVELLSSEELNARTEETVFEAVVRWIDHDVDDRQRHIADLLSCVRLGLLDTQYFVEKVKNHKYVRDNESSCRSLIIDALKLLCDLDMADEVRVDTSHPLSKPRLPYEVVFAVGGWSGGSPTNVIETYDSRADRWTTVSDEMFTTGAMGPRAYHGCATLDGIVYVIGGFDGSDYFNSVVAFNPVTKAWQEVAPMHNKRCYVSVAVLDSAIYAMGGFNGTSRQNCSERYLPHTNQWTHIAPMNQQRSDASATTLDFRVFIAGGFNGMECLSSAEYYEPSANQWTLVTPMRNRRSGVSLIGHGNFVYVIGGFNGITRLKNGERYDMRTSSWTNIAEMYTPRSNYGIEIVDDMIFAIGGFNGVTTIHSVECYDPVHDDWYDCTDMSIFRSALSACVVRGLSNVRDYTRELPSAPSAEHEADQEIDVLQTTS